MHTHTHTKIAPIVNHIKKKEDTTKYDDSICTLTPQPFSQNKKKKHIVGVKVKYMYINIIHSKQKMLQYTTQNWGNEVI